VTDEGGKRRQQAGGAHPQGGRQSEPERSERLARSPQAPTLQPQAVAVPAESGAGPPGRAGRRPPAFARHHLRCRPFERRRSTPWRELQPGLIEALAGPYASALERPLGRETAPPGGRAVRARRPPARSPSRRRACRGSGGAGLPPLTAGDGPAPGADRIAATRPHLQRRHRLDPASSTQPPRDPTLTDPRHHTRSSPTDDPSPPPPPAPP
jgi:hypothetical protein